MPRSKTRKRPVRPSKKRDKGRQARVRETQASQQAAEKKKISPAAYLRRRILGWSSVTLGIIVFVTHWLEHLGFFKIASPGVEDLVAGYPVAAALVVIGVIVLTK